MSTVASRSTRMHRSDLPESGNRAENIVLLGLAFPTSGASPLKGHHLLCEGDDLRSMIHIEIWQV